MCLVVDANSFSHVFNLRDKRHPAFEPVFRWVFYGNGGGLIYGGDKYGREVDFTSPTYRPLLVELDRKGRMFEMCGQCVDYVAKELKTALPDEPDFDDEHIVALVIVSKCHVVCTEEHRGLRFWKRPDLYPKGTNPPKIYKSTRNADLLTNNANVADLCRAAKKKTCRKKHA
jgi:hypothetical protein